MAEIPVERKGGIPWWVWLLLALLLLALLWWLLADDDEEVAVVVPVAPAVVDTDTGVVPAEAAVVGTAAAATGPITDLTAITSSTDGSLAGREVRLTGVTAGPVPDDAGFWLGGAGGERVWVVLEEVRTPNTPVEGRVDVNEGDTVDVIGTYVDNASARQGAAIPGPTQPLPEGVTRYILASRVTQSS